MVQPHDSGNKRQAAFVAANARRAVLWQQYEDTLTQLGDYTEAEMQAALDVVFAAERAIWAEFEAASDAGLAAGDPEWRDAS